MGELARDPWPDNRRKFDLDPVVPLEYVYKDQRLVVRYLVCIQDRDEQRIVDVLAISGPAVDEILQSP